MKKNITLLLFLTIGSVVFMASYTNKGSHDVQNSAAMLVAHSWKFEKAESNNPSSQAIVDHLYQNAQYNFTAAQTYQGEFFEMPIQGNWSLEGNKLILNQGNFNEELMEVVMVTEDLLQVRIMERGAPVMLEFRE